MIVIVVVIFVVHKSKYMEVQTNKRHKSNINGKLRHEASAHGPLFERPLSP